MSARNGGRRDEPVSQRWLMEVLDERKVRVTDRDHREREGRKRIIKRLSGKQMKCMKCLVSVST